MSVRETFRDRAGAVCWQKQLRDRYLAEGVPPVPHLDVGAARVRPVGRRIAEQVILKYEWLGTMSQTRYHYGIFFGDYCAGVTCVGVNVTGGMNGPKQFGLAYDELLILARGACVHWAPPGANSRLVAWTARLLPRAHPRGKLLLAYSDTDAGEIGTIYQACGWTYIGKGASTQQIVAPNGRIYDMSQIYHWRLQKGLVGRVSWSEYRDLLLAAGWTTQQTNPKHRYATVLDKRDKRLAARIAEMQRPYPKRDPADEATQ